MPTVFMAVATPIAIPSLLGNGTSSGATATSNTAAIAIMGPAGCMLTATESISVELPGAYFEVIPSSSTAQSSMLQLTTSAETAVAEGHLQCGRHHQHLRHSVHL